MDMFKDLRTPLRLELLSVALAYPQFSSFMRVFRTKTIIVFKMHYYFRYYTLCREHLTNCKRVKRIELVLH